MQFQKDKQYAGVTNVSRSEYSHPAATIPAGGTVIIEKASAEKIVESNAPNLELAPQAWIDILVEDAAYEPGQAFIIADEFDEDPVLRQNPEAEEEAPVNTGEEHVTQDPPAPSPVGSNEGEVSLEGSEATGDTGCEHVQEEWTDADGVKRLFCAKCGVELGETASTENSVDKLLGQVGIPGIKLASEVVTDTGEDFPVVESRELAEGEVLESAQLPEGLTSTPIELPVVDDASGFAERMEEFREHAADAVEEEEHVGDGDGVEKTPVEADLGEPVKEKHGESKPKSGKGRYTKG